MMYKTIALTGNPNVGKSTVFNAITGSHQHTGNWSGKTVGSAEGKFRYGKRDYRLIDLPGAYSLTVNSAEEEVTRNCLCFEKPDAAVVVCDACCLERNLILALQTAQLIPKTLICVNMMDDARRKGIRVDLDAISKETGLPVVGISASRGEGLDELVKAMAELSEGRLHTVLIPVRYPKSVEHAAETLYPVLKEKYGFCGVFPALKIMENDRSFIDELERRFGPMNSDAELMGAVGKARRIINDSGIAKSVSDKISSCMVLRAEEICNSGVDYSAVKALLRDEKIDSVLTGKLLGIPAMIGLFALIFWITVSGANYPSEILSKFFGFAGEKIRLWLGVIRCPVTLISFAVDGVWNVMGWVVSVMLPPMAIFFPLFTLLEDVGYLPRVAFNLDKGFSAAKACGKQALTMCMGLGCGAVGVTGARIIDSPRERMIAILTNSFMPCNGRFPALIALITMFFAAGKKCSSIISALMLTGFLALSVGMTFLMSYILSKTLLKGMPTGFTLELPPYRLPKVGKVIIRSVFERTVKVLGRAVVVAIPAGALIWLCSNVTVSGATILKILIEFFEPVGKIFGMDGTVLTGFLLSFPANEIALPIMAMGYSNGGLEEITVLSETAALFSANGFNGVTALCTAVFFLFHWPCATTLITIWKETKSVKWTALSVAIPLLTGLTLCFLINMLSKIILYL